MDAKETTANSNIIELAWPHPIPILPEYEKSPPYPVQSLPSIIRDAIVAYQNYGRQPLSLIACSALANVSLACQTMANVARDRLLISPVSLYFLSVASSGERKSSIDHAFSQAIRQWEQRIREALAEDVNIARTEHRAWQVEKDAVLSQIKRSALLGEDTTRQKRQLTQIMANEPTIPLVPTLFFEDATQEALASQIGFGWPSASLWSDEGAITLNSHGMQNNTTKFVALLNRLWDGKDFITHRKTSRSFTITNRRLTVSLMMQPILLQQMLTKNGGISRQSGFMARSLLTYPASSMGIRQYQEPPEALTAQRHFHKRITECLNESLSLDQQGCHEIPTLPFSTQAKNAWVSFFNETEAGLAEWGKWLSITDFASKSAENVARLAALFHLFGGKEGKISCEDIENAIQIIQWHLIETRRILGVQPQSEVQHDAMRLLQWITEKVTKNTTPQYLQQYSPIRDKARRDKALEILIEHHYLHRSKAHGKTILLLNPRIHGS